MLEMVMNTDSGGGSPRCFGSFAWVVIGLPKVLVMRLIASSCRDMLWMMVSCWDAVNDVLG